MSRFAALAAALACLAAFNPAAVAACTTSVGYRVPTNFELVRNAELIVLARIASAPLEVPRDEAWRPNVRLEIIRVLKGTAPSEPLYLIGRPMRFEAPVASQPTPLDRPHPSALAGACIRLHYPQDGLVVAMFERTSEGLHQISAPFARAVEDVEGADALQIRMVEEYVSLQRGLAEGQLRAAAAARLATLRARDEDSSARPIADDLDAYLDASRPETDRALSRSPPISRPSR